MLFGFGKFIFKSSVKSRFDLGEAETYCYRWFKRKGYQVKILKKDSNMISLLISSEQK